MYSILSLKLKSLHKKTLKISYLTASYREHDPEQPPTALLFAESLIKLCHRPTTKSSVFRHQQSKVDSTNGI